MSYDEVISASSVLQRFKEHFLSDLDNGVFQPGENIPGDRDLAVRYGVGRSSVAKVLKELQNERYLVRIPTRGTFIRHDLPSRVQPIRLMLVSQDDLLPGQNNDMFAWERISELMRGLFHESGCRPGVSITWKFCPPTDDPAEINRQIEDLVESDGIIFLGPDMITLKERFLTTGKPALVVAPKTDFHPERYPVIDINNSGIAERYGEILLRRFPGRDVLLLHRKPNPVDYREDEWHRRRLRDVFRSAGVRVSECDLPVGGCDHRELLSHFRAALPDLSIFAGCLAISLNRALLFPFLELPLQQNNIVVAGYMGGYSMCNHHPAFCYLHEPYFEIGRRAVAELTNAVRTGNPPRAALLDPVPHCGTEILNPLS